MGWLKATPFFCVACLIGTFLEFSNFPLEIVDAQIVDRSRLYH